MLLRKHVSKARIVGVEQLGFDRIVIIHLHGHGEQYRLVCELFRNGTVILVQGDEIVRPVTSKTWGSRDVKAGRTFEPPPTRANPVDMDFPTFCETVRASQSDLVRTLAARLGLGGEYAEALLTVSDHTGSALAASLTDEELGLLFENMGMMFSWLTEKPRPHIVRREGEPVTVLPIELPAETGDVLHDLPSFNDAVDAYFAETVAEAEAEEVSDEFMGHVERLRHQAEQQRRAAEDYEVGIAVNNRRGDLIYANFKHVEASLTDILEAKEALGWKEVEKRLASSDLVKELNTYDGYFVLPLTEGEGEPEGVKIRLNLTVPENAEFYYTRAKRAREKTAGAKRALEDTLERLEMAEAKAQQAQEDGAAMVEQATAPRDRPVRTRQFWFERFRWTIASDGTLIVGGKDASSNERVVKRYLKERDRYCHADFHGAPSVVVKDPGDGVSEVALDEACSMAAIYSKAWSTGRASADAYWVLPEQVSKTPQSGEFVPKGAFIIRGKRNYIKDIEMRAAVGTIEHEGVPLVMGGPVASVRDRTDRWVELVPSNDKKEATAKEVSRTLGMPLDEVMPVLPPGGCRIVGTHGVREPDD
jgi:predicted ribosome quality control (RQC) complex YloA/Tae2 family protein